MRLMLLFALACVPTKGSEDPATDADGDGVDAEEDCDDADPSVSQVRSWSGDLGLEEVGDLCDGSCPLVVHGDLRVEGTDAVDLDPLSCVARVEGDVVVQDNPSLNDLSGLDQVTSIGIFEPIEGRRSPNVGALEIRSNDALERIDGFNSLEQIGGSLVIDRNASLTAIGGFASLACIDDVVDGQVVIANNGALAEISGFSALVELGYLVVANNGGLSDLSGFGGLVELGYLEVRANDALTDISGFDAMASLGSVIITDNSSITNISGFNDLAEGTVWSLEISGSPVLSQVTGFTGSADSMDGEAELHLLDLPVLGNLGFLHGVEALGELELRGDHGLADLSGLESMTRMGWTLDIEDNDGLVDLSALYNLGYVGGDVIVLDNDALPAGAAQELVDQIDTVEGEIEVQE